MLFNPQLKARDHMRGNSHQFSKLCLSSHSIPIKLGRQNRTSGDNRLCNNWGVLGDERHFIYYCLTIDRSGLLDILTLSELYSYHKLPDLLRALVHYLQHCFDLVISYIIILCITYKNKNNNNSDVVDTSTYYINMTSQDVLATSQQRIYDETATLVRRLRNNFPKHVSNAISCH